MKLCYLYNRPVLALQDVDLEKMQPIIDEAKDMWEMHVKDGGPCVIGAGIGVQYLPKRCKVPREKIIIHSPVQGDGSGCGLNMALNLLARYGIPAFHVAGGMD